VHFFPAVQSRSDQQLPIPGGGMQLPAMHCWPAAQLELVRQQPKPFGTQVPG
jgi:hypothetical protein